MSRGKFGLVLVLVVGLVSATLFLPSSRQRRETNVEQAISEQLSKVGGAIAQPQDVFCMMAAKSFSITPSQSLPEIYTFVPSPLNNDSVLRWNSTGPVLKGYIVHVAPLAKPGYPLLEKAIGMCSIPGKHWSAGQMVNVVANLKSNEAIIQKTWNALSAKERKEIADAQAENLISLNAVAPYEVFVRQGEHWYKFKNWNDPLTIENLLHKLDK